MCKKNLIPWSLARKKFDEYQNRNSAPGNWKPEGMSTQLAERYGYDYKVNPIEQLNHVGYTIGSLLLEKLEENDKTMYVNYWSNDLVVLYKYKYKNVPKPHWNKNALSLLL